MPKNKIRGKLQRVSAIDAAALKELLIIHSVVDLREHTQRQAIYQLLPEIYQLKNTEGFTFKEISQILSKMGIKLSEPSLRVYYSQMLPEREDECIARVKELAPVLAEIKKETRRMDLSLIAERVTEIMDRKRSLKHSNHPLAKPEKDSA